MNRFFSFAVADGGLVTLVSHSTRENAEYEANRMKLGSNFRKVGFTKKRMTRTEIEQNLCGRGWTIEAFIVGA